MSGSVSVAGGAFSIAAEFDDLAALSRSLREAAAELDEVAGATARAAADPRLAAAAVLDPIGAGEVAGRAVAVCAAAVGSGAALAGLASVLAAAVEGYRAADSLRADVTPLGRGLAAAPAALADLALVPIDVASGHADRAQRVLVEDPWLADWALVTAASMIANPALNANGSVVRSMAGLLGTAYRDGTPELTRVPAAPVDDGSGPPRSVADLLRGLAVRDAAGDGGESGGGLIDVRFVSRTPGGPRSVIVDLPGTTRWNLDPLTPTPQVGDFGTNLRALGGRSTVYERGVLDALTAAGVGPDEPIMLVGHSEGGLVAAQLARDVCQSGRFTVTHVVTAGAPLGLARPPASVSFLSLENKHDVVPQLDGRDNPVSRNHLTVTIDRGGGTIGAKHAVSTYLQGAADVDASADSSLVEWRAQARGFLDGTSVQTEVFQIRRG